MRMMEIYGSAHHYVLSVAVWRHAFPLFIYFMTSPLHIWFIWWCYFSQCSFITRITHIQMPASHMDVPMQHRPKSETIICSLCFTACDFINIDNMYTKLGKNRCHFILNKKAQFIWINFEKNKVAYNVGLYSVSCYFWGCYFLSTETKSGNKWIFCFRSWTTLPAHIVYFARD